MNFGPAHPKTNAPQRTLPGQKMWKCPSYLASTQILYPKACKDCDHRIEHGIANNILVPVPYNLGRYSVIPVAERQDVASFNAYASGLYIWNYALRGFLGDNVQWNAGAANNASQTIGATIISVGSHYVVVRSKNPKRIILGRTRPNPEWPFADPVTGQYGKIVTESIPYTLPVNGVSCEFHWPSVLWGKVFPLVTHIDLPESDDPEAIVDYTIYFGTADVPFCNPEFAMTQYDEGDYGPFEYKVTLRFEAFSPDGWKDFQAPIEKQFTPLKQTVVGAGIHELYKSDGSATRVIYPQDNNRAVTIKLNGPPQTLTEGQVLACLSTVQSGGTWQTFVDLTAYAFTDAVVSFWAERLPADAKYTQCQASCTNSVKDPTGSYIHGVTRRCNEVESSGFVGGLYQDECWLPGVCNAFQLTDPLEVNDQAYWSKIFHSGWWVLEQGLEGINSTNNWTLSKKGMAGIQSLTGSFQDQVYVGRFPKRYEWKPRVLHDIVELIDEDDNWTAYPAYGAFYASNYNYEVPGASASLIFDAAAPVLTQGILASKISGWSTGKDPNNPNDPTGYLGNCNIYSYESGGQSQTKDNEVLECEAFVIGIDATDDSSDSQVSRIRGLYP